MKKQDETTAEPETRLDDLEVEGEGPAGGATFYRGGAPTGMSRGDGGEGSLDGSSGIDEGQRFYKWNSTPRP